MRSRHLLARIALTACFVVGASPAMADVIPPEETACEGRAAGDSCSPPSDGVCREATCTRLDYESWDRDASASPPSVSYDCLRCTSEMAADAGSGSDRDGGMGGGGGGCSSSGARSLDDFGFALVPLAALAIVTIVHARRKRR